MTKKFVTCINCMDGRAQKPVIDYMQKRFGVEYVDMITEPGPNKILSDNNDATLIESLKKRVAISVEKHGSEIIAIVGHFDCAGNPVDERSQKEHRPGRIRSQRKVPCFCGPGRRHLDLEHA